MPFNNPPPDTVPVRDAQKFDVVALEAYLLQNLQGFKGPISVCQFEGGQSNPTFVLDTSNNRYVLRKKPPGDLLASAHQVEREYRLMKALSETDFPVPEVYLLCEDPSVIGTNFYVMSCVEGRIFRDPKLPDMSAEERSSIYKAMCATAAKLHGVDWQELGLGDFGRKENYFARQITRWSGAYQATKTVEIPSMEKLIEWLTQHIPAGDAEGLETRIAHGDFRLENLIFHKTEPRVVAVLDWELSTLGHPLADLGYCCVPYHLPSTIGGLPGLAGLALEELGIPSEDDFVQSYTELTHRTTIDNYKFFVVFAMFRLAAITQGVKHRANKGVASSSRAEQVGALAKLFADTAWKLATDT